ncbi:hypothetical protein FSP39_009115 [Pinctada imbricata]|uniref:G-protein coupled receptors family 1 profile domain-containing protein n=1 Tax=Pinctada imbricata TaxID=66713 RepID=A0AA89BZ25_PINIB|nr:hypothetical protein FSP39_009115 [Pinctada imbricata]
MECYDSNNTQGNVFETNTTRSQRPQTGYDLPIYGLDDGQFYEIHIPAITCIAISFFSGLAVLISSFRIQSYKTFFSWTTSERFVVYLSFCDILFNMAHSLDHIHIVITRDHVYPKGLCSFYGFMLAEFISAQNLLVNIIAFNAFLLLYYCRQMNFGVRDWRLLVYTYGVPLIATSIAASLKTLGPNGTFCYFDGVRGEVANLLFTTVPLILVLTCNIILYWLTWRRIRIDSKRIKNVLGKEAATIRASHRVAGTMTIFVMAFLIQWWAMAIYGVWQLVGNVPQVLFQFVTTFSNTGGVINGIVYIIIRRRNSNKPNRNRTVKVALKKQTTPQDVIMVSVIQFGNKSDSNNNSG